MLDVFRKGAQRLSLLRAAFSATRDFPVMWGDVFKDIVKSPCTKIGPGFIEKINKDGEYLCVKIRSVPAELFWPKSLPVVDLYKVVTECFYEADSHFYEVPETRVSRNDVVLDCGAAEGIFSLSVLERAKQVIAFEPLPLFVKSMQKTFAQYSSKVSVQPYALSDVEGESFLNGTSLYGTVVNNPAEDNIPIQTTTIDKWANRTGLRVDFIKGDLESFEYKVLKGAVETIRRCKPKIALTVYHSGNNWREILRLCLDLVPGYAYRLKGISYNHLYARPVMLHLWPK